MFPLMFCLADIKEVMAFKSVESITRHVECRHATLLLTDARQVNTGTQRGKQIHDMQYDMYAKK